MLVEVKNVTKKFDNQVVLNNISFDLKSSDLVGFLGPNGSGKTTLMRIITGIISPDSGDVLINGYSVRDRKTKIRSNIGYLPENNPLYTEMYVREYLLFVAGLYKTRNKSRIVNNLIDLTGLGEERHKKIGELSKGYRQRVGIAQALVNDPGLLILDEPTGGLDPNQIIEIRNLIAGIGLEKTVLLSTHIMQEVEAICNRIIIINQGKIVAIDKHENFKDTIRASNIVSVEFNRVIDASGLEKIPGVIRAIVAGNGIWKIEYNESTDVRSGIMEFAVLNNLTILSLNITTRRLEDLFQEVTAKSNLGKD